MKEDDESDEATQGLISMANIASYRPDLPLHICEDEILSRQVESGLQAWEDC